MVTGPLLLLIFLLAVALLLLLIIRFRLNPFLSLLVTAILTGLGVGMPLVEIGQAVTAGFGNTLAGIGIVIGLGVMLGAILVEAGAIDQIATRLLRLTGEKHAPLAINVTGYLVSIPVFIDAAFVIFMPLIARLSSRTGRALIVYVTALSVGLITTHVMVIPTPGPLAVAANMNLNAGTFLLYALVVSVPAALVGGWLYGLYLGRGDARPQSAPEIRQPVKDELKRTPSGNTSIFVLLFPVLLILVGSLTGMFVEKGTWYGALMSFLGDKNIALLIGVFVALVTMRRFFSRMAEEVISESMASAGLILLITGAGGAFGYVINETGIGPYLVEVMTSWNVSVLFLGFLLSAILRAAQGSATVALITTSAILGPTAANGGLSPILLGLAVCAGGMCFSLPNDSAFWVVSRFSGLSVRETLGSWTLGSTLAGVVAFLAILALSLVSNLLPGL